MPICRACGVQAAAGKKFCKACGAPLPVPSVPVSPLSQPRSRMPEPVFVPMEDIPDPVMTPPEPFAARRPDHGGHSEFAFSDPDAEPPSYSRYAMMATEDYVGVMVLALIPGVNLILFLVWAMGGTKRLNLRSYARASLVMLLIGAVIAAVAFFIFGPKLMGLYELVKGYFSS